ncbi:MAG: hypothetical protein HOJ31_06690 [Anaerolineae bacterium]|nr:hypothetical protein [Anaerolineae bacterium]
MEEQGEYITEKEQSVFRAQHDKENPYVIVNKTFVENPLLSWKAKGLLLYLLSRPDNWTVQIGDLVKRSTDGQHAVKSILKELIDAGHIVKVGQTRDKQARFLRNEYHVYEKPCVKTRDGKPVTDNHTLSNKDLSNKESSNISDNPLFSKEANAKVQETENMINEVEKALGILDCVNMGGSGKWEKAIRYLIKMKKEKGWSFQVLWLYVNSDDVKYEKDKLSYGSLMKDPHALLKAWMPRAHAVQSEQIPDTKLYHKKYIPEASDEYIPNPNK